MFKYRLIEKILNNKFTNDFLAIGCEKKSKKPVMITSDNIAYFDSYSQLLIFALFV